MSERTRLTPAELTDALKVLTGWMVDGDAIAKTFTFANYYEAMAFVNAVAYIAHAADHHPDMTVGYNRVTVRYSTHDAGGVTALDVGSAEAVEDLVR